MISIVLAALVTAASPQSEVIDNKTVLMMTEAGFGDDVIIAKIKASPTKFDLSTNDMIALKKQGVSNPVLAAMIGGSESSPVSAKAGLSADSPDPMVPHPAGVYLLADWADTPKMVRVDPTTSNQTKTGGLLGYALTGGIASLSMKAVVPRDSARVQAAIGRPTFYFYFDQANQSLSSGAMGSAFLAGPAAVVTSPNEFSLIRFTVKKDRREARVGSFNIAGAKTGVMDKDRIAFDYEQIAPGVYKVMPTEPLAEGQYGFLYSMSASSGPALGGSTMVARVFDFGISKQGQVTVRAAN
ncbi:hypothetical protein NYR55_11715 [Sphingomonas sp. BGYR3]|uniref:hypothetical protein n=1 Tax=Sphingomonas sp. BGYR3 TaxID=2975483 RepID=UPI0021A82717|nr:hypothetical protein [Sphingomonas sp. BGYR3]MDG5489282.1 hypothetical protein [Sphingomonas sp. BGYR3]